MIRNFDIQPPPSPPKVKLSPPDSLTPVPPTLPVPIMTTPKFAKRRRGPFMIIVIGLVLILAVTMAGLYLFGPRQSQSGGVALTITGPDSITAGDQVNYYVTVDNRDENLTVADLTLEYPVGLIVNTTNPPADNQGKSLFHLGPLAAGEQRQVVITGNLVGMVSTKAELRGRLDYQPENFHSNFHIDTGYVTTIAASRVKLVVTAPAQVLPQSDINIMVTLQNTTDIVLNNLEIVAEIPGEFTLTSSSPNFVSTTNEHRWDVGSLAAGAQWQAQFSGEAAGQLDSKSALAVAVYQRTGQQRQLLDKSLVEFTFVQPQASLTLQAAGSVTEADVAWGAKVPVVIRYHGSSTTPLLNNTLKLRLEGAAVDWDHIEDPYGGHRDGNFLVWDSSSPGIGQYLSRIEQNSEGLWSLVIPIVSQPISDNTVKLVAILQPAEFADYQATAGPVILHVGSGLQVQRFGAWVDGALPPQVGQKTSYRITWTIARPDQAVSDVILAAPLPVGVTVDPTKAEVGQGSFKQEGQKIVWQAGLVGTNGSALTTTFTAQLTPTSTQAGSPAPVIGLLTVTGKQGSKDIQRRLDLLTTTMDNDPSVAGKWTVGE